MRSFGGKQEPGGRGLFNAVRPWQLAHISDGNHRFGRTIPNNTIRRVHEGQKSHEKAAGKALPNKVEKVRSPP